MAKITAADVNKLRKQTGAGMMDCKKALTESEGDFEKAIEILRKKGQKVAANRSDRESAEGVALAHTNADATIGYTLSINCETDFVAKNADFIALAKTFIETADASNVKTEAELLDTDVAGMKASEKITEQTGVIGEKIELKNFGRIEAPAVGSYIHNGSKIAVVVGLSKKVDNFEDVAKKIAMQVAAMNPIALNEDGISDEVKERELALAKEMLAQEGKPADMIEKIAPGKLKKFFKENTLLNQAYINDNKSTVQAFLKSIDSELTVTDYIRISLV